MKIIITIISFLLLYSCENRAEKIDVIELDYNIENYPTLDSSNILIKYNIISLEHSSNMSRVPSIDKLIEFENHLYILSSNNKWGGVFIFKSDGAFVKKINSGRGHGEYTAAADIIIDSQSRHLEVYDRASCAVLSYTLDGDYISKSSFPKVNVSKFIKLKNSNYLIYTPIHSGKSDNYIKYIIDGEIREEYLNKPANLPNSIFGWHINSSDDTCIYINGAYGNTCYKFDQDQLSVTPYLRIDPIIDINDKLLLGNSDNLNNKALCFYNFRTFSNEKVIAFSVKQDRHHGVVYDVARKQVYQQIFNSTPYLYQVVGSNVKSDFHYLPADQIEELKDLSVNSQIAQDIINDLLTRDYSSVNPYIIELSYEVE